MPVRELREGDQAAWTRMRERLWPEEGVEEAIRWRKRADTVTLIAESAPGLLVGFAEASARPYADGCETSPVAFLEGWYVEPTHRHAGWGRMLLRAVAAWARSRHLTELASDSLLDDEVAIAAHLHSGFEEVERSIKFRMSLNQQE